MKIELPIGSLDPARLHKYMHGPCTNLNSVKITAEFPCGGKIEMLAWIEGVRVESPMFVDMPRQQKQATYLLMAAQDIKVSPKA